MVKTGRRDFLLQAAATTVLAGGVFAARAQTVIKGSIEVEQLRLTRDEADLRLSYNLRFDLPREVEDALQRGVAVVFVARAETFRERWYWTDRNVGLAERRWRIAFQPLTRRWRVTLNGLHQHFNSLGEALSVMQRTSGWRVAENVGGDDSGLYTEFEFSLDRSELPRPLQISVTGQNDWTLVLQRRLTVQR